ncbi:MAG: glycoside hydrolase family 127 protein [Acidobacteria bacterium]|nr:glycoside hydrolase family 127 protein [Acidobacteriota bacterium]
MLPFDLPRRGFLKSLAALPAAASALADNAAAPVRPLLESFDYSGVRLLPGRLLDQYRTTRDFYLNLSEDDAVHGFRVQAGLPAPGRHPGGWCSSSTGLVFGQWLSGMARIARATGDSDLRDKAVRMMRAWAQCFDKTGQAGAHYPFDKTLCGLLDLHLYAKVPEALPLAERLTQAAVKSLSRTRQLASPADQQAAAGGCEEWYTLSENLYRAYLATGDTRFREFGDVWRYDAYWSRFLETSRPAVLRVHAYSHVNSFCGLPLAYAVSGDARRLQMARNAFDFVHGSQMFCTGGFGPGERLVGYAGDLGRSLELHADTAEVPCGSWAGFKLSRYLLNYSGEARYGDWIERLVYNGIGAALPMRGDGETFYYGDYRTGSGTRSYLWDRWPCCSGSYIQAVADYVNLIYFRDSAGLFVNLFVPSEVSWTHNGQPVKLTQETDYPETGEVRMRIESSAPFTAAIRFRVPDWASGLRAEVNGEPAALKARPSTWAAIERGWRDGDRIVLRVPLSLRAEPVDARHPDRVAILYGPVVLVEDLRFNLGLQMTPGRHSTTDLAARLRPEKGHPLRFEVIDPPSQVVHSGRFFPYWDAAAGLPYRMYHDFTHNELA